MAQNKTSSLKQLQHNIFSGIQKIKIDVQNKKGLTKIPIKFHIFGDSEQQRYIAFCIRKSIIFGAYLRVHCCQYWIQVQSSREELLIFGDGYISKYKKIPEGNCGG